MESSTPQSPQRSVVVPGQYLGFSLQASRLLDHLLRDGGPGVTVSLEVLGDTSRTAADGSVMVEELKSRTTGANPVSDRAIDFWKTIRNWVDAVQAGELNRTTTKFRLYVTREFPTNLAGRFSEAEERIDVLALIADARALFFQESDPIDPLSDLGRQVSVVFSAEDDLLADILMNFKLEFGSGRTWDDLRTAIDATFIPPDSADQVLRSVSGWVNEQVDTSIEQGNAATVAWDDFRTAVITAVRRLDRQGILASVASQPGPVEVEHELTLRTYVRQLDLIELEYDDKIAAVTDFLKAETDRVEWARRGHVFQDSFDAFEDELHGAWRNYRRQCEIAHTSVTEPDRGKLLYSDCFAHRATLQQSDLPDHFCRGSFHKLADAVVIGWHPRYQDLLEEGGVEDGDDA
jgi:hypothetical protein